MSAPDPATVASVRHYLGRIGHILERVAADEAPNRLLALKLVPDMFETGFNLAIAIQFAARALCPPAAIDVPEIPEVFTCESLIHFHAQITAMIEPIQAAELTHTVTHTAGNATLNQSADDYVARFALPNMIFHITLAYAALRQGGLTLGKADFDGLHVY